MFLAVLVTTIVASPVLGVAYRPDGWVRYEGFWSEGHLSAAPTAWVGNNIYNTTGLNQTAHGTLVGSGWFDGDAAVFAVTIENDGTSDRFRIRATTSLYSGVKYYHGSTNITSAVVAGTYKTPLLGHLAKYVISARFPPGTDSRVITITSAADPTKKDAVKLKVKLICGC
jgi:hypothetical protein